MNIFVSITIYPRLYLSANGGANWSAVTSSLSNTTLVWRLAITGTNIFAGTFGDGVFLSSDNGTSWSAIDSGLTYTTVYSLAITGSKIFAGTDTGGVFLSTNNGTNWTPVNEGLTDTRIRTLAVYGGNLFASTASDGVWRRSLSEMPTSVEPSKPDVPRGFSLCQNFPNPFNPTTTISFSLPSQAFVSLKVFDALGREVSTLVNEELSAGDHVLEWNAVNMPSGVYYYRLRAGASTQTRKLVLLR
jgi:photosystem II stability/assembly factor-like uncharacterized protein